MSTALPSNQPQFLVPADLLRYGMSSDFLAQFQLRPLTVQIVAGGGLGAMSWQWQQAGDSAFSALFPSEAAPPWAWSLTDPGFGILTFATGTYNANDVYNVSTAGVVTGGSGGGIGLISASRFDVRQDACIWAISTAITWMTPRVVAPVLSVGPQIFGWIADLAIFKLRSRQGLAPPGAAVADDQVRLNYEIAEKNLKLIGESQDRPPDLVDSSQGNAGAGFAAYPIGDTLRGW
jgi:hypothetical protein